MTKVALLGGGSFSTALAILVGNKGLDASIFARNASVREDINNNHKNSKYLNDVILPDLVKAYDNIEETIEDSDYIILGVPSSHIREICSNSKKYIKPHQVIINVAKGIQEKPVKRLSEVIHEVLPENPVVVLSGPSHAEEVAVNIPTTVVVSSENMKYANKVQDLFMTDNFRVYTNDDLLGVEIGGAVKNIIALAAGIADGIGYGDNSKAALMTRGMHEIMRIGTKMGGKIATFSGLTGMGDLIVTCTSMHSRNRKAGILIGQGIPVQEALSQIGTVEGASACHAFYTLSKKINVEMPITEVLYKVLFGNLSPKNAVIELMCRDKKNEIYEIY
ncbi:NAD(P)H-dependent glycerol-3-phosphate dehydrogenase [Clostridium sp. 19966]|uniref:NAD(P)H-dependent glycerol-3-phosphate dehydrogenase n=1 Tax=Clostridium sp. 19966 TaxID=2768166 RepID=UPI0028DE9E37|nr:NAD(P)H-dependent glycerol-3-phosphate dehydrogenase [Clostridium sp. 19966]MDT8718154.1 NAD(P)H-dependent glycerol-3-phosphate dehydrogenase [Clostridium sp. 19966]